jgi:hypothetical protein
LVGGKRLREQLGPLLNVLWKGEGKGVFRRLQITLGLWMESLGRGVGGQGGRRDKY